MPLPVRRLFAGEWTACALDGAAVICWGFNSSWFEFGASTGVIKGGYVPAAADVPPLASFARGNGPHTCGITVGRSAVCWGRGGRGQLGRGFEEDPGNTPAEVVGGYSWLELSVGRLITCGITLEGAGFCWGLNQYGEVGYADTLIGARVTSPYSLGDSLKWRSIAAGWLHACGVTTDGDAYCWGQNSYGQMGIGTTDTVRRGLTKVGGGLKFTRISAGSRYTCALTMSGAAYCWGSNLTGQLGDGTLETRATPTPVAGGHVFVDIVTGSGFADEAAAPAPGFSGTYGHTCAIDTEGAAYCWGWNGSGELGDGTTIDRAEPVAVMDDLTFDALAAGSAFTCGMKDTYVWCWGSNVRGQLGADITISMLPEPIEVSHFFQAP